MSFFYAIIIGIILGLANLSAIKSILIILGLIIIGGIKELIFKKDFITGNPSAYQLYLENLDKLNKSKDKAAIKYFLQSFLFDGTISIIVFAVVKIIF